MTTGMIGGGRLDPVVVGQRVLQAMRESEFYVFTHIGERATIQARHARIAAALDRAGGLGSSVA